MAKFDIEFDKVILAEGGYVDDADDAGGETYLGISRKNNPSWSGWKIIDEVKRSNGTKNLNAILKRDARIVKSAKSLYKQNYWDVLELDDIPSQNIAGIIFDTCVNCGKSTAIRIAQETIGMKADGKWSNELKNNLMKYGKG